THSKNGNPNVVCSGYCRGKLSGAILTIPVGTEKIRVNKGRREWFVKIDNKPTWRRKAVVVLETVLGRTLSRGEKCCVVFLDGDNLNCLVENLAISVSEVASQCIECGRQIIRRHKTKTGMCLSCYSG